MPKTYPKPKGPLPGLDERCPLCKARPYEAHTATCAWRLWAENPEKASVRRGL